MKSNIQSISESLLTKSPTYCSQLHAGVPVQLRVPGGHVHHQARAESHVPRAQRAQRDSARGPHLSTGRPRSLVPPPATSLRPAHLEQCVCCALESRETVLVRVRVLVRWRVEIVA